MSSGVPAPRNPVVVIAPGVTVEVNTPPRVLPDYPGQPGTPPPASDPSKTFVITQAGAAPKPPPTTGPNSNPGVPALLQEINYKPLPGTRLNAPIPIPYGRCVVPANRVRYRNWGSDLMVVATWGEGEIDAVEKVYAADSDVTIQTGYAHYTGTDAQTPDSAVASLFGQADALTGIAYSVLQLRTIDSLELWAIIRGRKVYDPRSTLTAYSNNAALCLADFITHYSDYDVDWDSVEDAADYCDEWANAPTNTIRRWQLNMALIDPKPPDDWITILAEYANCYVFRDDGVIKLLPDKPRDVDHVLTGSDVIYDSLDLRKTGQRDVPTQVIAEYTVPTATGIWATDQAQTDLPAEDIPLRITPLQLLGYQQKLQAQRKAVQWLNYANISDLLADFTVKDIGVKIVRGDVISLTNAVGLEAKELRVLDNKPIPGQKGRWRVSAREYSPLLYSSVVVANPDVPDTDLPDPTAIPTGPTPTEIREVLFTDQTNTTYTRFEIRFDGVEWAFAVDYRVQMSAGSVVVMDTTVRHIGAGEEHLVTTPPTSQGVLYTVKIWIVNVFGNQSATPGTLTKTGNGKTIPPTNPSGLTGREANQMVALSWAGSVDSDLRGYRIKRLGQADYDAAASDAARWDHANVVTVVSRIDSTRVALDSQPVGGQVYMVKAEDFAGNFSVGFTSKLVLVTEDQTGFSFGQELDLNETDSTNYYVYNTLVNVGSGGGDYVTAGGNSAWDSYFSGGSSTEWEDECTDTDQWTLNNGDGVILSEWWDTGKDNNGNWSFSVAEVVGIEGVSFIFGELVEEADYPPSPYGTFLRSGAGIARYARVYISRGYPGGPEPPAVTGYTATMKLPFDVTFNGQRVFDSGSASVPGAGSQPLAVVFNKSFSLPPVVKAQLVGSTPGFANPDNVTVTGFDLYAWDTSGAEMAATVDWTADGA